MSLSNSERNHSYPGSYEITKEVLIANSLLLYSYRLLANALPTQDSLNRGTLSYLTSLGKIFVKIFVHFYLERQ